MYITNTQKLQIVSSLLSVRGEITVLQGIDEAAKKAWENFRTQDEAKTHMIEGVVFSNLKTESLKSFAAVVVKLVMNAQGNVMNGYSAQMMEDEDKRFTATISRLASVTALTYNYAFIEILAQVAGYDKYLIETALGVNGQSEEQVTKAAFAVTIRKFDMCDFEHANLMLLDDMPASFYRYMWLNREVFAQEATEVVLANNYMEGFALLQDLVAKTGFTEEADLAYENGEFVAREC